MVFQLAQKWAGCFPGYYGGQGYKKSRSLTADPTTAGFTHGLRFDQRNRGFPLTGPVQDCGQDHLMVSPLSKLQKTPGSTKP